MTQSFTSNLPVPLPVNKGGTARTTAGTTGTTTNDNATTGDAGELITANASAVALTTATAANITSISLTAGDWDVWGIVYFAGGATTTVNILRGWVSSTSATWPGHGLGAANVGYGVTLWTPFGQDNHSIIVTPQRFSLSGTTTVYLSGQAFFATSTCNGNGYIYARRRR
jgi:hypothetical protein